MARRAPHTHVAFRLAGGDELRFVDARRFGWVEPARPFSSSAALGRADYNGAGEPERA